MSNTLVLVLMALSFAAGCWIGDRWRDWLDGGMEWLTAILAAVGVVALVVLAVAVGNGWRPV